MTRIADAKRQFSAEIEAELDGLADKIRDARDGARKAAKEATGLNGLAQTFHGLASMLDAALEKIEDGRREQRVWLGVDKEPITERTNPALLGDVQSAKAVEA